MGASFSFLSACLGEIEIKEGQWIMLHLGGRGIGVRQTGKYLRGIEIESTFFARENGCGSLGAIPYIFGEQEWLIVYSIRFSRDRPRFTDTLDMIKFLCKDVWQLIFRKQIDNLKTNHRVRHPPHLTNIKTLLDAIKRPSHHSSAQGRIA